ncbi:hypothetical protein VNI00_014267 [Paramarasmius palmivorus]|uniref:Protein kinase domain-containing protein n=1 Tax=Paramarasmius palmivorus TaxID=297713 RepID=A0AAW0BYJ2_9AGAR
MSSPVASEAKPKTPPPRPSDQNAEELEETPRVSLLSHKGFANATKMDVVREDIVSDLGPSIPEIPFDWFKGALLHRVEEELVTEVCEKLKEKNVLSDNGWTAMKFEKPKTTTTKTATQDDSQSQTAVSPNTNGHQTQLVEESEDTTDSNATVGTSNQTKESTDSETKLNEAALFKPLPDIFNRILAIVREKGIKTRVRFISAPDHTFKSEGNHGHYKSDMAALVEETRSVETPSELAKEEKEKKKRKRGKEETAKKAHECDVVLAAEFKLKAFDGNIDNASISFLVVNSKLTMPPERLKSSWKQNTNVRLWQVMSPLAKLALTYRLQDARDIVYLVLALGTASDEALGFDPTVSRVVSATTGDIGYRFIVDGEQYEVIEVISIYKAKFLLGRANRIFRVKRVLPSGELGSEVKVMKDVWIPQDAKTELEMRQHIYDNFGKNPVEGLDRDAFDKHFVVIEKCEYVKVPSMLDPDVLVNDSSKNFLRDHEMPECSRFILKRTTIEYKKKVVSRPTPSPMTAIRGSYYTLRAGTRELKKMAREHYGNKVHCRILMEDAGKPLLEVDDLQELVLCVIQAITGLMFLYSSGVVHRDISPGNIIFSRKDGELIAKLSDLEYAKDMTASNPANKPQDIKTGTPFFMAVEIEAGRQLFQPIPRRPFNLVAAETIYPSRYRYLHDLESMFWILVHFIFSTHPSDENLDAEIIDHRLRDLNSLFAYPTGGTFDSIPRTEFLKGIPSTVLVATLHLPQKLKMVLQEFFVISFNLATEYERVEKNPMKLAMEEPVQLYWDAQTNLGNLLRSVEEDGMWLGKVVRLEEKVSAGDKRKPDTITDNEGSSAKKARHD